MKLKTVVCVSLITIASLSPAHAQTFSVIHNFNYADGASPMAGVTLRGGNLYGTTSNGGAPYANGTVYQLTPSGDNWVLSSLYIFKGIVGRNATASPVFGPDGHLYGTTNMGGDDNGGIVYRLTPPVSICGTGDCLWTGEVLYEFEYDLACPGFGDLVFDQQSNIYGTAECGGLYGAGGVFQLSRVGNAWVKDSIYLFQGYLEAGTRTGVAFDRQGNLFGTTVSEGAANGTIYKLAYAEGLGWTHSVIYTFGDLRNGAPVAVTFDSSGNLFGETYGDWRRNDGTIFELSPAGDTWTYKLLYTIPGTGNCGVQEPLTIDTAGNLYGATLCGGAYQKGNIFKLSNTQNGWVYTSLHDFTGGPDGSLPLGKLTIDSHGNLYGTTSEGGTGNYCGTGCGTVWKIKP